MCPVCNKPLTLCLCVDIEKELVALAQERGITLAPGVLRSATTIVASVAGQKRRAMQGEVCPEFILNLQRERLIRYECLRQTAQEQANQARKPVNLYEVEPGIFGFRFDEQRKGDGYITTLQPER